MPASMTRPQPLPLISSYLIPLRRTRPAKVNPDLPHHEDQQAKHPPPMTLEPHVSAPGPISLPLPPAFLEPPVFSGPPPSATISLFPQVASDPKTLYDQDSNTDAPRPQLPRKAELIKSKEQLLNALPRPHERRPNNNAPIIPAPRGGSYIGSTATNAAEQRAGQEFPHPIDEVNMIQQILTFAHTFGDSAGQIAGRLETVGYPHISAQMVEEYLRFYEGRDLWGPRGPVLPDLADIVRP